MLSKLQYKVLFTIVFLITQGCAAPTAIISPTETSIPVSKTADTSKPLTTPIPAGVFALLIYPPLIMNYDTSAWKDESHYADVPSKPVYSILNYLQAKKLSSCRIGLQGPTGDFPATPEIVQLESVRYEVITFNDSPVGSTTAYYIENKSIPKFNYEMGTSVLVVQANHAEWNQCQTLTEKVLATLHVP